MASQSEIEAYSEAIDNLSVVAYSQLKALLLALDDPNPITFRDALLRYYPELMRPFFAAAGDVAAVWYTGLRSQIAAAPFRPVLAPQPPQEQLDAGVRYALSPLFTPEPTFSAGELILAALAGFTQRMIADQGRDTISGTAEQDRVRVGYQRVPRAGCCAFCGLLASRGAVYSSEASASGVVGRGGRRRGSRALESRYHDHCRCVVAPVFAGADNDYLTYTQKFFEDQYAEAIGTKLSAHSKKYPDGAQFQSTDLKATLANWRQVHSTR